MVIVTPVFLESSNRQSIIGDLIAVIHSYFKNPQVGSLGHVDSPLEITKLDVSHRIPVDSDPRMIWPYPHSSLYNSEKL